MDLPQSLIWALFGFAGLAWIFKPLAAFLNCRTWQQIDGNLISASIYEDSDSEGVNYKPRIAYWYAVNGRSLRGEQIRFGDLSYTSRQAAERILARYSAGDTLIVYFNPARPDEAVLDRSLGNQILGILVFVAVAFGGAVYAAIYPSSS